jgi:hypothetical protein
MKKINILDKNAMKQVVGGDSNLETLLRQMWEATPDGGSSTWTNDDGDNCWDGLIKCAFCDPLYRAVACY